MVTSVWQSADAAKLLSPGCPSVLELLGQKLAVDDVCAGHFSVRFKDGDVLVGGLTVVGVVLRVRGNALPVSSAEVVDFSDQASGIIQRFHGQRFSFRKLINTGCPSRF